MPITLRVTNDAAQLLGSETGKVFDESGGTIGRSRGNDWMLPDPQRYLSGRHAAIYFEDGAYWLADTSANGVYVNDAQKPVGSERPARLNDGDMLLIGDYEILVSIGAGAPPAAPDPLTAAPTAPAIPETLDPLALLQGAGTPAAPPAAPEPPPILAPTPPPARAPAAPGPVVTPTIPESLDPMELLGGGPSAPASRPSSIIDPLDPVAPAAASEHDHAPTLEAGFQPPSASPPVIPEDWDLMGEGPAGATPAPPPPPEPAIVEPTVVATPAPPPQIPEVPQIPEITEIPAATRIPAAPAPTPPAPAPAAARPPAPPPAPAPAAARPPAPPPAPTPAPAPAGAPSDDTLVAEFLAAAGMARDAIKPEQHREFSAMLGRIFRGVVDDMREVLMARAELKSGFRMDLTMIRPRENNPLKFSAGGVDEALANLLVPSGSGYLAPEEAFDEGFRDLKDHQLAMMAGMRATFESLLRRLDPERLEGEFEDRAKSLFGSKQGRYWELYSELFKTILADAEDDFQILFGEEFAKAYESQVDALARARKGQ